MTPQSIIGVKLPDYDPSSFDEICELRDHVGHQSSLQLTAVQHHKYRYIRLWAKVNGIQCRVTRTAYPEIIALDKELREGTFQVSASS